MAIALRQELEGQAELPDLDDPVEAARAAGLLYVTDGTPGIRRRRAGRSFSYVMPDGEVVKQRERLSRIKALAIPPAWTDVWICPSPRGHIQATGRDAKGRKQYRYHERWREVRDESKYGRMIAFGEALPAIRERVDKDLSLPGLPLEKVVATIVRLLDSSYIRIGNVEYARDNESFGLTTMREDHVEVRGERVRFTFRGKSGKEHDIDVRDRRLAAIVRRCQDLPGQELFRYIDDQGVARRIESSDVNEYLRQTTGSEFTAKDFRTWAGTVLAARELASLGVFSSEAEAKRNLVAAVKAVSQRLGNTQAVCRKCYVHPAVIDSYLAGRIIDACPDGHAECELAVLELLRRQEAA
jgi:DNA topoisomerase-1